MTASPNYFAAHQGGSTSLSSRDPEDDSSAAQRVRALADQPFDGTAPLRWEAKCEAWRDAADMLEAVAVPSCAMPPLGWACTRAAGHDGPCAAVPA